MYPAGENDLRSLDKSLRDYPLYRRGAGGGSGSHGSKAQLLHGSAGSDSGNPGSHRGIWRLRPAGAEQGIAGLSPPRLNEIGLAGGVHSGSVAVQPWQDKASSRPHALNTGPSAATGALACKATTGTADHMWSHKGHATAAPVALFEVLLDLLVSSQMHGVYSIA